MQSVALDPTGSATPHISASRHKCQGKSSAGRIIVLQGRHHPTGARVTSATPVVGSDSAAQSVPQPGPARREAERPASLELQFRPFPLQYISTPRVAAICRPFFQAGWTIKDILHAIDWRPNTDAKYHHDGARGVGNTGAWLKFRLGKWACHDGGFCRSPSQKREAERSQRAAETRAA